MQIPGSYICLAIGLFGLIVFYFSFAKSLKLKIKGVSVEGTITDKEIFVSKWGQRWAPVVTFADSLGGTVTFHPKIGGQSEKSILIGSKVPVLYDAKNSNSARVNVFKYMWVQPIIGFLVGVSFTLVGIATFGF